MNKKTYKYFKDRERKHQEEKIKDDEKFSKVLEKEYQRTLREIDNRINWWIGKYADDNVINVEQAKQIVTEADIKELKEKSKEYVKNKDLSPKANKEMRIYNLKMKVARDELLQKYIDLELAKLGTKEEKLLEDRIFNETEEELKRQAGILGDSLISKNKVKGVFEQIVNDSHVSAHFSYYIWTNIKELRNDLQNGLNRSILRGQNPNVWKSDLYKYFKGNVKKAEFYARRLAVTETAIAQTKAGLISAKENGYDKVIIITEPGACKDCKPHDGNIVDIDEAKMGNNVPIWHPFCRCTVAAYYDYADVIDSKEFRINGETYKVDGKHVVLDYSRHEKDVAKILANDLDVTVKMVPRVLYPQGISTPDYLIDNEKWDLKTVKSDGKNVFYNLTKGKKNQADYFVFDVSKISFNDDYLEQQVNSLFDSKNRSWIRKVYILYKGKIIKKYKK